MVILRIRSNQRSVKVNLLLVFSSRVQIVVLAILLEVVLAQISLHPLFMKRIGQWPQFEHILIQDNILPPIKLQEIFLLLINSIVVEVLDLLRRYHRVLQLVLEILYLERVLQVLYCSGNVLLFTISVAVLYAGVAVVLPLDFLEFNDLAVGVQLAGAERLPILFFLSLTIG